MSKHKKFKRVPEWGGEGFEESFLFSSMMNDTPVAIDSKKICLLGQVELNSNK